MPLKKRKVTWYTNDVIKASKDKSVKAIRLCALLVERTMKKTITSSKPSGRLYLSPGTKGGWHRASAPGQPPAVWTAVLLNSITHQVGYDMANKAVVARIGSPVWYAILLELGTPKMEPRPFLGRSLHRSRVGIKKIFAQVGAGR